MAISVAYEAVKHACNVVVGYHDAKLNSHRLSALQEPAITQRVHPRLVLAFDGLQAKQQCLASRVDMIATRFPDVPRFVKPLTHFWRNWLGNPANAVPHPFALVSVTVDIGVKFKTRHGAQHDLAAVCTHGTLSEHTIALPCLRS
jgi:hypothetical protein